MIGLSGGDATRRVEKRNGLEVVSATIGGRIGTSPLIGCVVCVGEAPGPLWRPYRASKVCPLAKVPQAKAWC